MKRIILFVLVVAVTVGAQTANVIELDPADTARAKKAWDALQKAQAEWDLTTDYIRLNYVMTKDSKGVKVCGEFQSVSCGFEFSKDFRFIVPKVAAPQNPAIQWWVNPVGGLANMDCSKGPC
jgi:hypothetical protein